MERRGKIAVEAHEPNQNLNSRTSTVSILMFLLLSLSFRAHRQLLREVPACKSNTKEKKGFCNGLIQGSWKDGSAEASLSLSLFMLVQQPCFLMKMSRWMRALDARSNPV